MADNFAIRGKGTIVQKPSGLCLTSGAVGPAPPPPALESYQPMRKKGGMSS